MLNPSAKPIPDSLRDRLIEKYRRFLNAQKMPFVTGFEKGLKPGEIIFKTPKGDVVCAVTQDNEFVYFRMPSICQKLTVQEFSEDIFLQ